MKKKIHILKISGDNFPLENDHVSYYTPFPALK